MKLIEKFIEVFSPSAALRRTQARLATTVLTRQIEEMQARGFNAAGYGRRLKDWYTPSTGPNNEISRALVTLRNRSRDLTRNNAYGRRAVRAVANNVVGSGIRPSITGRTSKAGQRLLEEFNAWAKTCDWDNNRSLWHIQKQVITAVTESGECLVIRKWDKDRTIPLGLQVLEADHLDHTRDLEALPNGGFIRLGVEFDSRGKKVAYWVYKDHPGENWTHYLSDRIEAKDCLHIYDVERPGQVRGIPTATPVIIKMRDLDEYEDAQLVRQKIAACFSVFVTKPGADFGQAALTSTRQELERVEPGIIEYLNPGEQVSFAAPPVVNGDSEFIRRGLLTIAAAFDITYEMLTGDLRSVNFSSGRMGWIEAQRSFEGKQENVMYPWLDTVWGWFLEAAFAVGVAPANAASKYKVGWTPPRREMLDPAKEALALVQMIQAGLISWQEAVRSLGWDPAELAAEIQSDKLLMEQFGINVVAPTSAAPPSATAPEQIAQDTVPPSE